MKPSAFFSVAYALGLTAVVWVAATAVGGNALVLVMTLVIGGVFTVGALELRTQRAQVRALSASLAQSESAPVDLEAWLSTLPEVWRQPVRLRLRGDRVAPPAPVLTPYLVGLLVMLGMLGTFLGMVVTLSGTAFALQSLTDIQGIRVSFSEPIKGLGLAFGASVAGVATSAMLGLMSTLTRHERSAVWRQFDDRAHGAWQVFDRQHQLQQAWSQLQANTQALPQLVEHMGRWMNEVQTMQNQFNTQWLAQQERHLRDLERQHQTLADRVEQSLSLHLGRSTQEISGQLRDLAQGTLAQVQEGSRETAEQLRVLAQNTLGEVQDSSRHTAQQLSELAHRTLNEFQTGSRDTAQQLRDLAQDTLGQVQAGTGQTAQQLRDLAQDTLGCLGGQAAQVQQALIQAHGELLQAQQTESQAHLARIEAQLVQHLGQLGAALEAPLARLIEVSSQAPQAAADVIAQLRQRINDSMARDNELLAERAQLMDQLAQASQAFGQQVQSQGEVMGEASVQLRASAIEVASLAESFGVAVQTLHQNQEQTLARLQQIESALSQSMQRSDEQLASYVAQAREVIELSVAAQQPMIESLDRVSRRLAPEESA